MMQFRSGGMVRSTAFRRGMTVVAIAILLAGCAAPTPEERIRRLFAEAEQAAEEKEVGTLIDFTASDFAGSSGLDRRELRGYLFVLFQQHEQVFVLHRVTSIDVGSDGTTATARAAVAMAGAPIEVPADLSRISADLLVVETDLRVEDGEWRVAGASWRSAVIEDFF